jgi:hypothetical protein
MKSVKKKLAAVASISGDPDPNEALFKKIMQIIDSKSKRALDKYADLQKQIKNMIEDDDVGAKFIKRVEQMRQ